MLYTEYTTSYMYENLWRYLFDLWLAHGGGAYAFTPQDVAGYKPNEEWTRFRANLPPNNAAWPR
eukprot:6526624-Lingulodinium_polyedra.AAC.1